jgi:hypothetical protein
MHKLAICAIAKNENSSIQEWIYFHRVVGVEHFYIYDNDSVIPLKETLSKEIIAGFVTCIDFPGLSKQMPAYNDCLKNYWKDNKWIAFIDCDEFLLPKGGYSVPDLLSKYYYNYGSLQVNWVVFGSNGHIEQPNGLVMENYTKASTGAYKSNLHTKAIVQSACIKHAGTNPHYFVLHSGFEAVNEKCEKVSGAFSKSHSVNRIQLNHYTIKSLEDFKAKIAKGRADAAHLPTVKMEDFVETDRNCIIDNFEILKYVDQVKLLMNT